MKNIAAFLDLVESCAPRRDTDSLSAEVLQAELVQMAPVLAVDFCKELQGNPERMRTLFGPLAVGSVYKAVKQHRKRLTGASKAWTECMHLPFGWKLLSLKVVALAEARLQKPQLQQFEASSALALLCGTHIAL